MLHTPMRLYLVALLAACSFNPPNVADPDGPAGDGPLPDAGPCQTVGTKECVGDELRSCVTEGELPIIETCGWGCDPTGTAHCLVVSPSGGVIDKTATTTFTGLGTVTVTDQIDTEAGTIEGATAGDFTYAQIGNAGVFTVESLVVPVNVQVIGSRSLVIVANGPITISGIIDLRGCSGGLGVRTPGPGGYLGGLNTDASTAGGGPGGGAPGSLDKHGGGGGGHGSTGGPGGNNPGSGGQMYTDLTILDGGSGGGGGKKNGGGVGGGGGGAIQLVSNTSITIATSGAIDAGGCGGLGGGGGGNDGGGGGGAGGAILLEAPTITIDGSLAVNGGGGGASNGGVDNDGASGTLGRTAAAGGITDPATTDGANGGAGGFGNAVAGVAGAAGATGDQSGSGGGGAAGRIRFNTRLGAVAIADPMKLSPNLADATTCTLGTATIAQP